MDPRVPPAADTSRADTRWLALVGAMAVFTPLPGLVAFALDRGPLLAGIPSCVLVAAAGLGLLAVAHARSARRLVAGAWWIAAWCAAMSTVTWATTSAALVLDAQGVLGLVLWIAALLVTAVASSLIAVWAFRQYRRGR